MTDYDDEAAAERRERHKARELRQSQWWKRQLAKGVCHWCGKTFPAAALTMDHILPISRGGKTVKGNVVACCKDCNNRKKYLLPTEWVLYVDKMRRGDGDSTAGS